ncbi:hypothetical protein [Mycobacteroides abscessus]
MTALTVDGERNQRLIRDLRGVGIEIPVAVESELNIYRSVQHGDRVATVAVQDAQSKLRTCSPDEWDEATQRLSAAVTTSWNLNNGLTGSLLETATDRLTRITYHHISEWFVQVVAKLNAIVDETGWNHHVRNLPTFGQKVRVLSITKEQGAAIEACRDAVEAFRPLWHLFQRLATLEGYESSVGRAEDFSRNANLFYMLSDGDWSQAQGAATMMAGAAFLSDSASEYAELLPFVFPGLVGADLNFATPAGAGERRRIRQGTLGIDGLAQYNI